MVSLDITQKFTINVAPVPVGSVIDGPPTYPTDVPNVVIVVPSPDGLTAFVMGHTAGTCTITPTALANGAVITGAPIQVTVTAPPPPPPVFATSLSVSIGPVEAQ